MRCIDRRLYLESRLQGMLLYILLSWKAVQWTTVMMENGIIGVSNQYSLLYEMRQ